MSRTITIEGMGCDGCEDIVENALTDIDAATDASADHESGTATIEGDVEDEAIRHSLELAGYDAELDGT